MEWHSSVAHWAMESILAFRPGDGSSGAARTGSVACGLWNPTVVRPLSRILEQIQPDVVNTHNIDGFSPLVWKVPRKYSRVVHTLHDFHLICPRAIMQRRGGTSCPELCRGCSVYASYHQFYQRFVDAVISPTHMVADLHRSAGWTSPKSVVIRNAVDLSEVSLPEASPVGPLQVVFMSRLVAEKGCETLIRAMQMFCGREDAIHFHIAGEGPYAERLAQLAVEEPHLTWHGYVKGEQKAALLSRVDIFLQLSEWRENAPLSVLEAKHFGNYVIATRMGGLPELIDEPLEGQLICAADPGALVSALERQIVNRADIREHRRQRAVAAGLYGIPEMSRLYSQVFASVNGAALGIRSAAVPAA
jgi:glycosyltransferase involved in cell wall biosynthesis